MRRSINREIMQEVYILLEKYEEPKSGGRYWGKLMADLHIFCQKYSHHPLAENMANAIFTSLEEIDKRLKSLTNRVGRKSL